jgi:hypothetical protein
MKKAHEMFYLSIYFLIREDKYYSKTVRTQLLLELVLFMLCASMMFILFGALNIRTDNFVTISILVIATLLISNSSNRAFFRSKKVQTYILSGQKIDSKRRTVYSVFGLVSIISSFAIMILSAILMSFLWSLRLF